MTARAQDGEGEPETGPEEQLCRAVQGEPSRSLGLPMMVEVNEDVSQDGIVPEISCKNRVIT